MGVPNLRNSASGTVTVDLDRCTGCGLCIKVCGEGNLILSGGKAHFAGEGSFGCITCGQCMAVCAPGALTVTGRDFSENAAFDLAPVSESADYGSLMNLLYKRRSIRRYKDIPVDHEITQKLIEAASTAPMGIPPWDVHLLVLEGKEKVKEFSDDFCKVCRDMKIMTSPLFAKMIGLFLSKMKFLFLRDFLGPLLKKYIEGNAEGKDFVMYGAPLAIYFYGTEVSDPADPVLAATYAMIAAESLGLGSCMLGAIHPMIQNGPSGRKLREKFGIKYKSKNGIVVIFGYPEIKFKKGIKRTFASVEFR